MKTADLLAALEAHYTPPAPARPGGTFVAEVGVNGAMGASSRCDAVHVGYTSSSGRILRGHEIKVSRADWLNEVNKPAKADAWSDACHEWWIVVPDPAIIHPGEKPDEWGVLTPVGARGRRLKVAVPAARKPKDFVPPWWAVRSVMSRLDNVLDARMRDERARIQQEAYRTRDEEVQRRVQAVGHTQMSTEDRDLLNAARDLQDTLGVQLTSGLGVGRFGPDDTPVRPEAFAAALTLVPHLRQLRGEGWDRGSIRSLGNLSTSLLESATRTSDLVGALTRAVDAIGEQDRGVLPLALNGDPF